MKRFGVLLSGTLLLFGISGCDSGGISEGPPPATTAESSQPAGLKAEMQKNAGKMGVSKKQERPKNAPATKDAPAPTDAPAAK